jgi:hypothetical protein
VRLPYKILAVVLLIGGAYGVGRYLQPAEVKVKTETKVVKVEVEKERTKYRTITKYIKRPDGTEERIEEKEEVTEKESSSTKRKDKKKDKQIIAVKPQWKVQAMAELDNFELNNYRVGVERRVIGPVFAGAWASTTLNSYGVSLSMEF